jgi:hypothetical protein
MAKQVKTVRLSDDWDAYAKTKGVSIGQLIETALEAFRQSEDSERVLIAQHKKIFDEVHSACQLIEAIRDYPSVVSGEPEPLSEDAQSAYELYNRFWEELRQHNFNLEP